MNVFGSCLGCCGSISINIGNNLQALGLAQQKATGVGLLWATQNLFSHPRFMNGASTNPNLDCYAWACAKTKMALDVGHKLGGENHVFWGGREGYQSTLNTNARRELDHMAAFLHMVVDYKAEIGVDAQCLIEPKPREPTKHQVKFCDFLRHFDDILTLK